MGMGTGIISVGVGMTTIQKIPICCQIYHIIRVSLILDCASGNGKFLGIVPERE